jgi:hypothetical protein
LFLDRVENLISVVNWNLPEISFNAFSKPDLEHLYTFAYASGLGQAIAVGGLAFVEKVKGELGVKASHRDVIEANGSYALREPVEAYGLKFAAGNGAVRAENKFFWNESVDEAST